MSGWWLGLAGLVATGIAGGDGTTRWEVHSSLVLPRAIWLVHGTSGTVRVTEIELDLQLACTEQARDARTIRCLVEDAAMRAAPMPGDAGAILAIDEAGSRLTGATVILTVKRGQIRQVNLATQQPLVRSRSITRARDENLRLIVSRAMAGFDLKDAPDTEGAIWSQRRSWFGQLPAGLGTRAVSAMVHEPHAQADGTRIVSGADLTMAADMLTGDGSPPVEDTFRGEVRAEAHLDATGALLSRRWALQVEPTAGSAIADGTPGLPYVHTGSLRRLRADEAASIGQTGAIAPKHTQPSALQSGHFLGVPPRAVTSPALPGGSAPEHTAVGSGEAGGGAGG